MSEQKIEQFWRDATAEDVARVMKGEKVVARFRDYDHADWTEFDLLGGFATSVNYPVSWFDVCGVRWFQCQVYDPPEWFKNKPDPGEGYRLLEKFPDEDLREGDEIWVDESWCFSWRANNDEKIQKTNKWYRRRIQPVPQSVGSRSKDNIPSGWQKIPDDEPRLACDAYWSLGAKDWIIIGDARLESANRDKWPAIRQVNSYVSLMSSSSAFEYRTKIDDTVRLPNGKRFKVTKEGFEVL